MNKYDLVVGRTAVLAMFALAYAWNIGSATPALALENEHLRFDYAESGVRLQGSDARAQLQVYKSLGQNSELDVSREAHYQVFPETLARVDKTGYITPLADGTGYILALQEGTQSARIQLEVTGLNEVQPVNFANQVVPVFTKLGCNSGGCHGKSAGQAGFRLSLLGFEARDDFEHLVVESRGRRLFPADPSQSLLLLKATNASPHGGGQKLDPDSQEYRVLHRWIAGGMPFGSPSDPVVSEIAVLPESRQLPRLASQQLTVVARYSDGSLEDITRTAQFESNNTELANVSERGLVTLSDQSGDASIMVRYQGQVAVFRASIPLGIGAEALAHYAWPTSRNLVDELVFAKLRTLEIPPSALCDDATFVRRATLDLAGRLPTVTEYQQFTADEDETKFENLIDRLLASDDYAELFAKKWSSILRNRRSAAGQQFGTFAFHDWLTTSFRENKPYDQLVRELLTATGSIESNPPVAWLREVSNTESRLEDAAQLFLGQRIQCAHCHHHPFEKWSQNDYFQMSAFFSKVARKEGSTPDQPMFVSRLGGASAQNPKTGQSLIPAGLDAEPLQIASTEDPRQELVSWMIDKDNPFFAKSLVNRYWKHFFSIGMVEPEDDMRATNPPSNPELLDGLAHYFTQSGYDLRALLRVICTSNVYRLSSEANDYNLRDNNCYSRYYPKRLQAEVLLDSVDQVTQTSTSFEGLPAGSRAVCLPDNSFSSYFLDVFGKPDSTTACECERSQEATLAQSLHLLNSKEVQAKLSSDTGRAARAVIGELPEDVQIRELYNAAVSRQPTEHELRIALEYIQRKPDQKRQAFEDLVWAMINSKEFLFNH